MTKRVKTDSEKFVEDSFKTMAQLIAENKKLQEKVDHLEDLLKHADNIETVVTDTLAPLRKPLAEEIIEIEIKRLHDQVVNGDTLEGSDLRKFDTLVKDLVALKGSDKKNKKKKKDIMEDVDDDDLMKLINDTKAN